LRPLSSVALTQQFGSVRSNIGRAVAARLRFKSPLAKKLLDQERAHAAVNTGDDNDAIFFTSRV
jgi:hypothetical protein